MHIPNRLSINRKGKVKLEIRPKKAHFWSTLAKPVQPILGKRTQEKPACDDAKESAVVSFVSSPH